MSSGGSRRVLFPFVGDTVGGSHISALTLVRGLSGGRYEPATVVHSEGPLETYLREVHLPWGRLQVPPPRGNGWGLLTSTAAGALPLARYLKAHGIDIVHTNDARMHCAWLPAAKIAGVKHVWHQRSLPKVPVFWAASCFADEVIAISAASVPREASTTVIPNPVAPNPGTPARGLCRGMVLREVGVAPETVLICWVANWIERKRPLHFLEVAAEVLRRTSRPVAFLMFGEPRESTEVAVRQRVRDLALDPHIHLLGTKWPIEPWINGCDLMVSTAIDEAFGRTLVEAMLLGTPVVATADAGHLEVVESGYTGWLVPPDDVAAFADAVVGVIEQPDHAAEVATTARREALAKYSVERHVRAVESVYDAVLAGRQ